MAIDVIALCDHFAKGYEGY